MSLIIKKNTTFKIPRTGSFLPSSLGGLALWLKADAGVSKFSFNYISQIVISGTSNANVNGTYTATSVPSYDFNNGVTNSYSFSGPSNGFSMNWDEAGSFFLTKNFDNGDAIFASYDGQTWTITSEVLTQVVISGFDGDYEGANGIYNYNTDYEAFVNGDETYAIYDNGNILNLATDEILATNTNANYSGNWTLVNGTGDPVTTSVTIIPNGSISGITTTSTANTDFVSAWADQSGNGNNATPPADPPAFISSSINSKPAISFNGDGSWMQIPQNGIGNNGNISIFIVLNYTSGLVIFNKGDLATFPATVWEITTSNGFGYVDISTEEWKYATYTQDTGLQLFEGFASGGVSQVAINGTNVGTPSDAPSELNNILQYIGIGGGGTNGSNNEYPLDARIAEIIIYNRQVTTSERQQIEAYLNQKYQIY